MDAAWNAGGREEMVAFAQRLKESESAHSHPTTERQHRIVLELIKTTDALQIALEARAAAQAAAQSGGVPTPRLGQEPMLTPAQELLATRLRAAAMLVRLAESALLALRPRYDEAFAGVENPATAEWEG
jgi:hypothetical protein